MILHYAPNTISIAVAIALDEAGLEHSRVAVDFKSGEQRQPDYLALNPKGRVPALETPQGVLTETGAIFEYLASRAPDLNLVPADPWAAAQMRSVMYYLASTMHVNHAHKYRGLRWANEDASIADMRAKVPETMAASCAYIENHCALDPFVMGREMTVADPWLFTICTWLEGDGVQITDFPRLAAFYELMQTRPSIAAVRAMGLLN